MIDSSDDPYGSALEGLGATKIILKKPIPPKTTAQSVKDPANFDDDIISPGTKRMLLWGGGLLIGGALLLMVFKRMTKK